MFKFIKNHLFGDLSTPSKDEGVAVEKTSQALFDKIMGNFKKYPPRVWTGWESSCNRYMRENFFLSCTPQIPYMLFVRKSIPTKPLEAGVIVGDTTIPLDIEHAKLLLKFLIEYDKKEEEEEKDAAWAKILKS